MDVFALGLQLKEEGAAAVKASVDKLRASADTATNSFNKFDGATSSLKTALTALGATAAVTYTFKRIIDESSSAQFAQAQLASVLKSTGQAAGQTIDVLNAHADALSRVTAYEDDAITGAQNLLLTFTKIKGDVFPKATEAVLDIAQAMGGDLQGAAIQVGKALNDPIVGITALQRVGVSFSEAQKDVIKNLAETGRLAEAQTLILKELETEFGGSARAARETLGGALKGLQNDFGNLFEMTTTQARPAIVIINDLAESIRGLKAVLNSDTAFGDFVGFLKDAALYGARLTNIGIALGFIKKQLADAANSSTEAAGAGDAFVKSLQGWQGPAKEGAGVLGMFSTSVLNTAYAWKQTKDATDAVTKAGTPAIELYTKLAGLTALTTDQASRLAAAITAQKNALGELKGAPTDDYIAKLKQIKDAEDALASATIKRALPDAATLKVKITPPSLPPIDASTLGVKESKLQTFSALDEFRLRLAEKGKELQETVRETFAVELGAVLGTSIASAFEAAFATGKIGEGFKALTASLLGGLGSMMVDFGTKALLTSNLMEAIFKFLQFGQPGLAAAAALEMIAIGGALKGLASRTASGGSSGNTGSYGGRTASPTGGGSFTLPGVSFGPTMALAGAGVSAMAPVNVTVIGPNDPSAQRAMQELLVKANRRGSIY